MAALQEQASDFTLPVLFALGFSGLSLIAALGAFAWSVSTFLLSGGRAVVKLNLAEVVPYAGTYVTRTHNEGVRRHVQLDDDDLSPGMELAAVVNDNPGRLPITLTGIELAVDGARAAGYSVTPRLFHTPQNDPSSSPITYRRLEPYSRVTVYLDFWAVVESERRAGNVGALQFQGQARIAGKRRPARSKRRLAWRIGVDDLTSREDPTTIAVSDVVLRELMRDGWSNDTYDDGSQKSILYTPLEHVLAKKVGKRVDSTTSVDELKQILTDEGETWMRDPDRRSTMGIPAINIHRYLSAHAAQVRWND